MNGLNTRFDFTAPAMEIAQLGRVHFLAVGGSGMSGVAALLADAGLRVDGCDAAASFALSYLLFAVTGAADTVSTVIRATIRQIMTPDRLRGRMTGINMIFFMGGPQLGEMEAGLVAAAMGVPFAIVSGGVATVVLTLWIAKRYPGLRRYTSDTMNEDRVRVAQAGA